ncbi:uncharacterized protein BKA55DRAFT_597613 [Fusarium redolens]|uniref:Uncharacterized protein n=1 Tax=Fusarium redolens TaxID=48865 RepID=A0A9P9GCS6_FUSRE|nr:uncharacterized protein BKA55DRAFT_597613 [Fusarium redolens]KAH7237139.1 hypothetical protein BKA55DRAFT_597613 [Fusarium redolens]
MLEILNDIYANPEKIGAKNLVDWFMTNGGKEPRHRYQAEVVNHFCHSNELQELQSNSSNLSSRKSCLIDDRTSNGIVSTSNGNRKPLTSHGMYARLVEKRFHEPPSNGGFKKPNTDRRLVGMQVDPFTTGKHDADLPILNPDDYFLISLQCQLLVFKQRVETYVDEFDFALASKESQQPLAWLRHARRKLTELVVCLETTIDCWDNFTYPDHMQTRYGRQSMVAIEQTFAEVRNCLKELYNIRTLCDEHERTLNLHNINEQYRISRMQAQVAESCVAHHPRGGNTLYAGGGDP